MHGTMLYMHCQLHGLMLLILTPTASDFCNQLLALCSQVEVSYMWGDLTSVPPTPSPLNLSPSYLNTEARGSAYSEPA